MSSGVRTYSDLFNEKGVAKIPSRNWGIWKHITKPNYANCYRLDPHPTDLEGYLAIVRSGYYLEDMDKFPWYDFSEQKAQFPNGTLKSKTCYKKCPTQTFFDFKSVFCRRCNRGCGVCKNTTSCDECIPGRYPIENSTDHAVDDLRKGECLPGCRLGFYMKRYEGECGECAANCSKCLPDAPFYLVGGREATKKGDSYCTVCKSSEEDEKILYVDIFTGECIDSCKKRRHVVEEREEVLEEGQEPVMSYICSRCHDQNCFSCRSSKAEDCRNCITGYALSKDGACTSVFSTSTAYTAFFVASFIFVTFLILCVVQFCQMILESKSNRGNPKELTRGKTYNWMKLEPYEYTVKFFSHFRFIDSHF